MKQLYYIQKQWKFVGDSHWHNLYFEEMRYGELPNIPEETYQDFQFTVDTFDGHSTRPFIHYTLFRQKPRIILHNDPINWTEGTKLTARNFKPFAVRWDVRPVEYIPTMKRLMEDLEADDFIEYCKDKGVAICMGN